MTTEAARGGTPEAEPGLVCRVLSATTPEVAKLEKALDQRSFALPLPSRASWAKAHRGAEHVVVVAEQRDGSVAGLLGMSLTPTRAVPLHVVARVECVTDAYATPVGAALLRCASDYARRHRRVLSLTVEIESRDETARAFLAGVLEAGSFVRIKAERSAERTIALELAPTEAEILAGFRTSHRQNVRNIGKHDLQLEPIRDASYSPRMNELLSATMARTGSWSGDRDWGPVIRLCEELPHRSRLIGVFRGPGRAPAELLAFAWGLHHGLRGEYSTGASTRVSGNPPLLHAVLWDLIVWSKREGAAWFDFGGVTPGGPDSDDPLGRISFFKRGFSRTEIDFGQEWVLTPSPWKARVAGVASRLARRVRQLRRARPVTPADPPPAAPPVDANAG
jgi:hypothetical protein